MSSAEPNTKAIRVRNSKVSEAVSAISNGVQYWGTDFSCQLPIFVHVRDHDSNICLREIRMRWHVFVFVKEQAMILPSEYHKFAVIPAAVPN